MQTTFIIIVMDCCDQVYIPPHVGYVMSLQLGAAKHSQKALGLVNIVLSEVFKRFVMFVAAWEGSK